MPRCARNASRKISSSRPSPRSICGAAIGLGAILGASFIGFQNYWRATFPTSPSRTQQCLQALLAAGFEHHAVIVNGILLGVRGPDLQRDDTVGEFSTSNGATFLL